MIIIGILMPLYAFCAMSYEEFSKDEKFKSFINSSSNLKNDTLEKRIKKYNEKISKDKVTFVDPFSNEDYKSTYDFYKKNPDKVFAYLRVPSLDIKMPIYLDASNAHLAKGAAHIDGTALPTGEIGRSVIAGHRGYYKEIMFYHLDRIKPKDKLYIDRNGETYEYEAYSSEVIYPYDWDKLKPVKGKDIVTLLTCEPKRPPRPRRLIVNFKRIEETKKDLKEKKENAQVDKKVLQTKYLIYSVTILGTFLFIYVIFKFIKYLRK